jgi:hypothetical protein
MLFLKLVPFPGIGRTGLRQFVVEWGANTRFAVGGRKDAEALLHLAALPKAVSASQDVRRT